MLDNNGRSAMATWRGSLFTWRPPLPVEEVPLREEVVAVETRYWREMSLIGKPADKIVPRVLLPTVTRKFLFMEENARPKGMERQWDTFTTTALIL